MVWYVFQLSLLMGEKVEAIIRETEAEADKAAKASEQTKEQINEYITIQFPAPSPASSSKAVLIKSVSYFSFSPYRTVHASSYLRSGAIDKVERWMVQSPAQFVKGEEAEAIYRSRSDRSSKSR